MRSLPWLLDVIVAVELEVSTETMGGLYAARVSLGSPAQQVWAGIDTASPWLWVPRSDFNGNSSSSFREGAAVTLPPYADGLRVAGNVSHESVDLGGLRLADAPFLLATASGPGLLGLEVPLAGDEKEGEGPGGLSSLFEAVWQAHPELPRAFRLELGGPRPRLLFGAEALGVGIEASDRFTRKTSKWYVGVRAMGISYDGWTPANVDFNDFVEYGNPDVGLPALLDSGSGAIRLSQRIFDRLMRALPDGCHIANGVPECPCPDGLGKFPSLSISFEAASAWRFLGLDSGDDFVVCVPPEAYVRELPHRPGNCQAEVVGVPHSRVFGSEAIVLGVPFFRAAAVVFDLDRRRIALESRDVKCSDPKNVLHTGHRFSLLRFVLVFGAAAVTAVAVHERYAQSSCLGTLRSFGQGGRAGGRTLQRVPGDEGEAFVELTSGSAP